MFCYKFCCECYQQIVLQMNTAEALGLCGQCAVSFFDFNHNRNLSADFRYTPPIQISSNPFKCCQNRTRGQNDRRRVANRRISLRTRQNTRRKKEKRKKGRGKKREGSEGFIAVVLARVCSFLVSVCTSQRPDNVVPKGT